MSKLISLTKGYEAIVSDEDYDYLSQWKWRYGGDGYAVRDEYLGKINGRYQHKTILMHRVVMDASKEFQVDHINRNRLDNRKENLRLATQSQNRANINPVKRRKVELPMGVTYNPSPRSKQPYMARICKQGKSYFLGNFYTVDEAETAYRQKKLQLFGEFA